MSTQLNGGVNLREICLKADVHGWRLFMLRRTDPAFLKTQQKIHARDGDTCQFCHFQAATCLEVVNLNGNYLDNKATNLATACGFCTQCFFLESIGKSDFGSGALIYLPEMTQNELNALCHILSAAMVYRLNNAMHAKNIYLSLKLRSQLVEEKVGEGLSNPAQFGQMLLEMESKKKHAMIPDAFSETIRLLPNLTHFASQIASWARAGINELTT